METVKASGKDTTGFQEPAPGQAPMSPASGHCKAGLSLVTCMLGGQSQGCSGGQGTDLQSLDLSLNPNDKDKTEMQKFPECHH